MDQEMYQRIIATYQQTGSVDRTAELCHTYAIKVRKVLITEGLWRSKKSDAVNALRERGYSAAEIAATLGMEEKNVQFYFPYTESYLSADKSSSSARVRDYRERERKTAEGNLFRGEREEEPWQETQGIFLNEKRKGEGSREPDRIVEKKHGREVWSGYQLHIELVKNAYASGDEDAEDVFSDVQDPAPLQALLKTKSGISREVIVPGKMSLHQLSYVIQELFGFMNSHLHHFSLPKALFRQLTEGEASGWAEMCGVYLHVPAEEDFSDLYWDDNYRDGKSFKAWRRSKYIGEQPNYAVGETYMDSMRLLKEARDDQDTVTSGNTNMLLERLKMEELFSLDTLGPSGTDAWRDDLRKRIGISQAYLEAFRETESYRSLEDAMGVLRTMRADRANLDRAIWRDRDKVKAYYGRNPETMLEEAEAEIQRLERQIGDAMHAFDPAAVPVTDTIYYSYDYGDDWLFRICCREIYSCYEEDHPGDGEIRAAFQGVEKQLGFRDPDTDRRMEACQWGRDYTEDLLFFDSEGREVNNMLYLPLCSSYLEGRPVCIRTEGLPLAEDVGGVSGFFDFIGKIHGEDPEEAASLRQWARSLGWKEIVPKPGGLL